MWRIREERVMKWYQMDCDAQDNPDMRKLIDKWGWDWYGRYYAILGKIGQRVDEKNQTFTLQTNDGSPLPIHLLADDLGTTSRRLIHFCNYLADNHLIDQASWRSKTLIYAPKLEERADEYTKKLRRKSGQTPESVRPRLDVENKKKEPSTSGRQKPKPFKPNVARMTENGLVLQ
jgi:hypothetical protein